MPEATTVTTVTDPGRITASITACAAVYRASAADVSVAGNGYTAVAVAPAAAVVVAVPRRNSRSASATAGIASINAVSLPSAVGVTVINLSSDSPTWQSTVPESC